MKVVIHKSAFSWFSEVLNEVEDSSFTKRFLKKTKTNAKEIEVKFLK
jgi:hypothetical protein